MNIQSPQFLTDLYGDLRDRRLLPLIVVLLAAMAVVPIALSSKSSAPTTTAAAPATPAAHESPLLSEQVSLSDPGIRKYQKRLNGDAATDPFVPRVQGTSGSSTTNASSNPASGGLTSTSTSSSPSSGADVPLTAEGQAAAAAANGSGTSASASLPSGGSTTGSTRTGQSSSESTKIVFYRLKIRSGQVGGEMKVQDEVGPSTSLPSKDVAALAFLGVTFDGNLNAQKAYFLVSNGVSVITGTGGCAFGAPCQLVAMKPGDYMDLTWSDGQQYRVKLLAFERHVRNDPNNSGALTSSPTTQTAPGSGSGRHHAASHSFSF
jgi:hypothetical protein